MSWKYWSNKKGVILDTDYQEVINYAISQGFTLPNNSTQRRDSNRVSNLKAEGVWALLDVLYIFEQSEGCSDFGRINFKSPSDYYLQAAPTYSLPTFEANNGFKGGIGLGFNTGWNASINAVNFLNNDASFVWKGYDFLINKTLINAYARTGNNTSQNICVNLDTGDSLNRIATTSGTTPQINYESHNLWSRIGSSKKIYNDGLIFSDVTGINGPGLFSNLDLYIMCGNENGITVGENESGLRYMGWGADLSSKANEIYQIMDGIY